MQWLSKFLFRNGNKENENTQGLFELNSACVFDLIMGLFCNSQERDFVQKYKPQTVYHTFSRMTSMQSSSLFLTFLFPQKILYQVTYFNKINHCSEEQLHGKTIDKLLIS